MTNLPPNVYTLPQRCFEAIPGSPWVYWVSDSIRDLFETLPRLGEVAQPRQGLAIADNTRFCSVPAPGLSVKFQLCGF